MASWSEFAAAAPELAERVQERASTPTGTRRSPRCASDGSPRISGTEAGFADGELYDRLDVAGGEGRDLQRDPRFALHSGSDEPDDWHGDAKVAGVAVELRERRPRSGEPAHSFRLDLHEVSIVGLNEERNGLVIDVWTARPPRTARATCSGSTSARSRRCLDDAKTHLVIDVWTPQKGARTITRD